MECCGGEDEELEESEEELEDEEEEEEGEEEDSLWNDRRFSANKEIAGTREMLGSGVMRRKASAERCVITEVWSDWRAGEREGSEERKRPSIIRRLLSTNETVRYVSAHEAKFATGARRGTERRPKPPCETGKKTCDQRVRSCSKVGWRNGRWRSERIKSLSMERKLR